MCHLLACVGNLGFELCNSHGGERKESVEQAATVLQLAQQCRLLLLPDGQVPRLPGAPFASDGVVAVCCLRAMRMPQKQDPLRSWPNGTACGGAPFVQRECHASVRCTGGGASRPRRPRPVARSWTHGPLFERPQCSCSTFAIRSRVRECNVLRLALWLQLRQFKIWVHVHVGLLPVRARALAPALGRRQPASPAVHGVTCVSLRACAGAAVGRSGGKLISISIRGGLQQGATESHRIWCSGEHCQCKVDPRRIHGPTK
jgi:hypothetical protein